MKKLIILAIALSFARQNYAQTEYARIAGFSSLEDALPALFFPLPNHSGFKEINFIDQYFIPFTKKYTDFGVVQKRVTFTFKFEGGDIVMYYQDHQMEDKTKGEWEVCPDLLNKKDKSVFNEFVDALENIKKDEKLKAEAFSHFYCNSMALLGIMKQSPEKAFELWSENSLGLKGQFSYLSFIEAKENSNSDFDNYQYQINLEIRQATNKIPLNIVMYANLKSKSTNPEGASKNIMALNKKENYWFTKLNAKIVSFKKLDDGTFLMVLKDFSKV